jgi:hypothetical protein
VRLARVEADDRHRAPAEGAHGAVAAVAEEELAGGLTASVWARPLARIERASAARSPSRVWRCTTRMRFKGRVFMPAVYERTRDD